MRLRADYDDLMEKDAKLKAEKERKKREHEEDMFLLDLKKAEDAAQAKGEAMQKKMREIQDMEKKKKEHEDKIKKSNEVKQKQVEDLQRQIHNKNKEWDEKRFEAVNKSNTISEADYK